MKKMKKILITGGSGLVGRQLEQKLKAKGYEVLILSRSKNKENYYVWDWQNSQIDIEALQKADIIVHLAGANVGEKKWTSDRKKLIENSRTQTAKLIFDNLKKHDIKIEKFISASATGFYGSRTSPKIFTENDQPANDFLGTICQKWENSAHKFSELGIPVTKIRVGVVLANESGALPKIAKPVRMGVGSALGTGKQYIPWIHLHDLTEIFMQSIENKLHSDTYNAVAPQHITNLELTKAIAKTLGKPLFMPKVPQFTIKMMFGEMSEIVLEGSRVSSQKLVDEGFVYKFPEINSALKNLLIKKI